MELTEEPVSHPVVITPLYQCRTEVQQYCHFMQNIMEAKETEFNLSEVNLTLLRKLLYISKMLLTADFVVTDATYEYLSCLFVRMRFQPPFDADLVIFEALRLLSKYLSEIPNPEIYITVKRWVTEVLPLGSLQRIVNEIIAL